MNKKLILILLATFSLAFLSFMISAESITAGSCNSFAFSNSDNVTLNITGNTYNTDGFLWSQNGTNITYCFDERYKPDNLTLTFYNYQTVEVTTNSGGSGGGGSYHTIPSEQVQEGITKLLSKGSIFYFQVEEKHKFTVLDVNKTSVKIKVESTAQIFDLKINESKKIILDDKTIEITLNSIQSKSYADISLKIVEQENKTEPDNTTEKPTDTPAQKDNSDSLGLIIALLVFIILVVAIWKYKSHQDKEEVTKEE